MRAFVLVLTLGLAAPAAAQPFRAFEQGREAQAIADAQAARTRDIQLTNQLSLLQAQMQTQQALGNLQAARATPAVPTVPFNPRAPAPVLNLSQMASIPDAALAASNARILAAAGNRR
jgi:hypothetical protein